MTLDLKIEFTLADANERQLFGQFCDIIDNYRTGKLAVDASVESSIEKAAEKIEAEVIANITPAMAPDAEPVVTTRKKRTTKVKVQVEAEPDPYEETDAEKAAIVQPTNDDDGEIPTLEQTSEAIQEFANARSVPEAVEMLQKHGGGATKMKDLAEELRAPLITALKAALAEGK